jgi:hypothetical protein
MTDPVNRELVWPVATRFACRAFLGAALAEAVVAPGLGLGVEVVDEEPDAHAVEPQAAIVRRTREDRDMARIKSEKNVCGEEPSADSLEAQIKSAERGIARSPGPAARSVPKRGASKRSPSLLDELF